MKKYIFKVIFKNGGEYFVKEHLYKNDPAALALVKIGGSYFLEVVVTYGDQTNQYAAVSDIHTLITHEVTE